MVKDLFVLYIQLPLNRRKSGDFSCGYPTFLLPGFDAMCTLLFHKGFHMGKNPSLLLHYYHHCHSFVLVTLHFKTKKNV